MSDMKQLAVAVHMILAEFFQTDATGDQELNAMSGIAGHVESWPNFVPAASQEIDTLADLTGFLRDGLLDPELDMPHAIARLAILSLEGMIDSDNSPVTREEITHTDLLVLAHNVCGRHFLGALSEIAVAQWIGEPLAATDSNDETSGIDLRFADGMTVQVKASFRSFSNSRAIGQADILIQTRVNPDLSVDFRIGRTA